MENKNRKIAFIFLRYLLYRADESMIFRVAAALSYTTLLAVIPFISVILAFFAIFPMFNSVRQQVKEFIIQYVMPDAIQNVQPYVVEFIGAAGQLTTIGAIGLVITTVLMLSTIENSFNFIFKVRKHRRLAAKMTYYWFIIIACPLLLSGAFLLKGYLLTLKYLNPEALIGNSILASIMPHILTFICLILAYFAVPNKKVRLISAIYGAGVSFCIMLLLRFGFGYFLVLNVTYKTLYGALATFPIFLVWMFSWWTVVLCGAVVTASIEDFKNKRNLPKVVFKHYLKN